MKKQLRYILFCFALIGAYSSYAQSVSINADGATPDASAMLDITDTTRGILIPRMTAAQRLLIPSPSNGLLVFQTDFPEGFYVYYSLHSAWARIMVDSVLSLETVLELGNNANADTIINLNALAIGGTNPTSPLHISVDGTPQVLVEPLSNFSHDASIVIRGHRNSNTFVRQSSLHFQNFDSQLSLSNSLGTISGVVTDDLTNIGDIVFYSYPDGITITEAMRIKSDGNVGIGTATPSNSLSIYKDTSAAYVDIKGTGDLFNYSGFKLDSDEATDKSWAVNHRKVASELNNLSFEFFDGASTYTQAIILDPDGKVGIGITGVPTNKLDVNGSGIFRSSGSVSHPGGVNHISIAPFAGVNFIQSSIGSTPSPLEFQSSKFTVVTSNSSLAGGADRFVIDSDGNVGIGTSTPNAPLQFSNALANRKLVLFESSDNDHQFHGFGVNSNTLRYQVPNTTGDHVFYAASSSSSSSELLRIEGTGNVGIGTPTPNAKLEVNGSIGRKISTLNIGTANDIDNLVIGADVYLIRLTGPNSPASISGIDATFNGHSIVLFNASNESITIENDDGDSVTENRILMHNNGDLILPPNSSISFIYSTIDNRWIGTGYY